MDLPITIGKGKGVVCMRTRDGFDLWVVWLNKEFESGEKFELSDIDKVSAVLHFADKKAIQNTIDALQSVLKHRG